MKLPYRTIIGTMRRAYSLIEVLVVSGIIALLAAIAGYTYRAAKASAKNTACIANLRSIGQGVHLYAEDFDQFVPPYLTNQAGIAGHPVQSIPAKPKEWRDSLNAYVKSKETFFCPLDRTRGPKTMPGGVWDTTHTSYETTGYPFGQDRFGPDHTYRISLSTPTPEMTRMPYAVDKPMRDFGAGPGVNPYFTLHGKRQNLLYLDGRVKLDTIPDRD